MFSRYVQTMFYQITVSARHDRRTTCHSLHIVLEPPMRPRICSCMGCLRVGDPHRSTLTHMRRQWLCSRSVATSADLVCRFPYRQDAAL